MSENNTSSAVNTARPVILIACGDFPICRELITFLERYFTVYSGQYCSEVFDLASLHFPDIILLSADKQYCDGIKICEKLQKNLFRRRPAQVMLFGPEDDELIDKAFEAGADEYIREPVHWNLLRHRANSLIQRRRDSLELSDFTRRLEQINRELESFTYVVSHDLQEPLHLIRAFANRITTKSHSVLDRQGTLYLQRIELAAGRMQSLIDGLLQYSRLTTQAKEFESVDLSKLVKDVIGDLEVRIDQLGAIIKMSDLGKVEADPLQMRQLFQNLVSNALKYSSDEAPLIEILSSSIKMIDIGPAYRIIVKDNGIGFDSCFQEQIFGMFQRLHGRDAYNGTGIGLAICEKIVERHGGTISAYSSSGQGAEFVIVLPVRQIKKKQARE